MFDMTLPDPDQFQLFTGQALRMGDVPVADDVGDGLAWTGSLELCVLGSGSGGNCTAVQHQGRLLLIDAGFGPRTLATRLKQRGAVLSQVKGICLTHLDSDHFRPHLIPTLIRWGIPVYLYENHLARFWRLEKARELHDAGLVRVFTSRPFSPASGLTIRMMKLSHDAAGTCAFRLEALGCSIGYATDLGHVPEDLVSHFADVNLLAIESNYDKQMQLASARPMFLKQRIMNGSGHLSNDQCLEAIHQIITRSNTGGPNHIVLLHRSRQCNCPKLVTRLYEAQSTLRANIVLSEQDAPSPWMSAGRSP